MRKVLAENIETGVRYELAPTFYNANKLQFVFIKYVDVNVPKKENIVAKDIHQMNKKALLNYAKDNLKLEVTDKMTIKKLKEAIVDFKNTKEDIVEI